MKHFFVAALIVVFAIPALAQPQRTTPSRPVAKGRALAPTPDQPVPMTNEDVLTMVEAGLDEGVIVAAIRKAPATRFDVSAAALIEMKRSGVPVEVVKVMIDPTAPVMSVAPPPASVPSASEYPSEMGVYVRNAENGWKEIDPEIVNWKTGGMLKNIATVGLAGAHVNGTVDGPRSMNVFRMPLEVLVVTAEGSSITEYQLLDMWEKSSRREFRAAKMSVFGASGGAKNNVRQFAHEKLASRTYVVRLDALARGEWGLLPPGALSTGNMASSGKIYTFTVE